MFGKSVFESVLERLKAEAAEAPEDASHMGEYIRSPTTPFVMPNTDTVSMATDRVAAAYRDFDEDVPVDEPAASAPPPPSPPHLMRTSPEDVAADLGLTGNETSARLAELRRAFARDNHPDGVADELRQNATRRMMIANMLIDETLQRMKVEAALGLRD